MAIHGRPSTGGDFKGTCECATRQQLCEHLVKQLPNCGAILLCTDEESRRVYKFDTEYQPRWCVRHVAHNVCQSASLSRTLGVWAPTVLYIHTSSMHRFIAD